MSAQELESILRQVERLSADDQLRLIKRVTEMLSKPDNADKPHGLIYGKYQNAPGPLSTEEDFRIAEWQPTEKDLNGP
jgi:hypothetical protein